MTENTRTYAAFSIESPWRTFRAQQHLTAGTLEELRAKTEAWIVDHNIDRKSFFFYECSRSHHSIRRSLRNAFYSGLAITLLLLLGLFIGVSLFIGGIAHGIATQTLTEEIFAFSSISIGLSLAIAMASPISEPGRQAQKVGQPLFRQPA